MKIRDPLFEKEVRERMAFWSPMVLKDPELAIRLVYFDAVRGSQRCPDPLMKNTLEGLSNACLEAMGGEVLHVEPDATGLPWNPWAWAAGLECARRLALRNGVLEGRVKSWLERTLELLTGWVAQNVVA